MSEIRMGGLLRDLRNSKNLTQSQLAKILNVSPKAVSKWENDAGLPDLPNLRSLAEFYGITTDDLLRGSEQPKAAAAAADDSVRTETTRPRNQKPHMAKHLFEERLLSFLLVYFSCGAYIINSVLWTSPGASPSLAYFSVLFFACVSTLYIIFLTLFRYGVLKESEFPVRIALSALMLLSALVSALLSDLDLMQTGGFIMLAACALLEIESALSLQKILYAKARKILLISFLSAFFALGTAAAALNFVHCFLGSSSLIGVFGVIYLCLTLNLGLKRLQSSFTKEYQSFSKAISLILTFMLAVFLTLRPVFGATSNGDFATNIRDTLIKRDVDFFLHAILALPFFPYILLGTAEYLTNKKPLRIFSAVILAFVTVALFVYFLDAVSFNFALGFYGTVPALIFRVGMLTALGLLIWSLIDNGLSGKNNEENN